MVRKLVDIFTSLKLTIVCLAAGMALIFAGTLAQVHLGIHEAQQRYFQSMFVWWPPDGRGFQIPIFPGGHLIGAVLLINLIAAHLKRFRWSWRKLGIHLTHAGLIIMLAGGLFTDLFAVESHMQLANGDTKNYSDDMRQTELGWPTFEADAGGEEGDGSSIRAPIIGRIAKVFVKPGDTVAKGDRIAVVEAMKMEHVLHAARAGRIAKVAVTEGQQVTQGALIAALAED